MNPYSIISLRCQSSEFLSSSRSTFSLLRSAYLYPVARKLGLTVMCLFCLCHFWFDTWYGSVNSSGMGVLIPQSLQLQMQVMLTNLGWCYKTWECAWIVVFLQSGRWRCQYWSAYIAAAVTWLAGSSVRFVRLALKVIVQNDLDFVNVIVLYRLLTWLL